LSGFVWSHPESAGDGEQRRQKRRRTVCRFISWLKRASGQLLPNHDPAMIGWNAPIPAIRGTDMER
jgi:hypothetical protein